MKIRNKSKVLFAGMLATTPSVSILLTAIEVNAQMAVVRNAETQREATYMSQNILLYKDNAGISHNVRAGIKIVRNNNFPDPGSVGSCSPASSPDSVSFILVDAETNREISIVGNRWFGNVRHGYVALERSESSTCTGGKTALMVSSGSVQFQSLQTNSTSIYLANVYGGGMYARVEIPNNMVFVQVSLR